MKLFKRKLDNGPYWATIDSNMKITVTNERGKVVFCGDSFDLYAWQRANRIPDVAIIWGDPYRDPLLDYQWQG